MIIDFSVVNFKSIKDRQTISFIAGPINEHNDNLVDINFKDVKLLPIISLYGKNGSGKTNMLSAMRAFYNIVVKFRPHINNTIPYSPNKYYNNNHDTSFRLRYLVNKTVYEYFISYNNQYISKEELYYYPNGSKRTIFERNQQSIVKPSKNKELKTLLDRTRPNRPFISVASEFNYQLVKEAFDYISNNLNFSLQVNRRKPKNKIWERLLNDVKFKRLILDLLKKFDFDIIDFEIEKIILSKETFMNYNEVYFNKQDEGLSAISYKVQTLHEIIDKEGKAIQTYFDYNTEESAGTHSFLEEITEIIFSFEQKGNILIIDELDLSLHPLLLRYIIDIFQNEFTKNRSQLLFTTHNTEMLNLNLFRRDQIYLVDRNHGYSEYYSLFDVKGVRSEENARLGYLKGRYGAVPNLNDVLIHDQHNNRSNIDSYLKEVHNEFIPKKK